MITNCNIEQEQAALLDTAKHGAEKILEAGQEVCPLLLCFINDKNDPKKIVLVTTPIPMHDRRSARHFLHRASMTIPLFVTVQEIWISNCSKEEAADPNRKPPSEDPNRREGVCVTLFYQGKAMMQDMLEFTRKDGKAMFGKWSNDEGGVTSWTVPSGSIFPEKEKVV